VWLPLAEEVDGRPVMNPNFTKTFDAKFKNKMSRVIIACQDGGGRSEIACKMVTDLGYTAIATIEGGVEEYLKAVPLTAADKKARVARVQQEVGIKYGGTGVTDHSTPDDSA
jgi:formylmethanofuran:tetrahydromethanopterin formyltransferase